MNGTDGTINITYADSLVIKEISGIKGVISCVNIINSHIPKVIEAEYAHKKQEQLLQVENLGVRILGKRNCVLAILKDVTFRAPPGPTLYLVSDITDSRSDRHDEIYGRVVKTDDDKSKEYQQKIEFFSGNGDPCFINGEYVCLEKRVYHIIGEEVFDTYTHYNEKHVPMNENFILFPARRKKYKNRPAFFLIPPIIFPELEKKKKQFGIDNIISISPGVQADNVIRSLYSFSKSEEYATILVGFDIRTCN